MAAPLRLLAIFPHPDDETLGMGGTLAKYAAEGVDTRLICATRGERGWSGPEAENPGLAALGRIREAELRCAADHLGLREVVFLDYIDGDVDQAEPQRIIAALAAEIRRIQPDVVVTFSPDGHYGHPDHIALAQFTNAAALVAADASHDNGCEPHRISKLYFMVESVDLVQLLRDLMGGIHMTIDGAQRSHVGWEEWAITTRIDCSAMLDRVWRAVQCHKTQLPGLGGLAELPRELQLQIFGVGDFVRVFSLVNGGRAREDDLFAGLRR